MCNEFNEIDEDVFGDIDSILSEFDGVTVDGGVDPSIEDDCTGGACKI